jgi:hypothetical protein
MWSGDCALKIQHLHDSYGPVVAFDVNSALGFKNSFGFLEQAGNINDIITGIDEGFHYGAIIGQVPELNTLIFENISVMAFLRAVAGLGDPSTEIVQVLSPPSLL